VARQSPCRPQSPQGKREARCLRRSLRDGRHSPDPSIRDSPSVLLLGPNGRVLSPTRLLYMATEPRQYSLTVAGPPCGQSSSGRVRVRPRDYPSTTPRCPTCRLPSAPAPSHHMQGLTPSQPGACGSLASSSVPNGGGLLEIGRSHSQDIVIDDEVMLRGRRI